jgi:hypothetical protein
VCLTLVECARLPGGIEPSKSQGPPRAGPNGKGGSGLETGSDLRVAEDPVGGKLKGVDRGPWVLAGCKSGLEGGGGLPPVSSRSYRPLKA